MPNLPWQSRQDAREAAALAALLAGTELPAGSPQELRPVADTLAALKAGPAGDELAGEAAVLSAFRAGPAQPSRRRPVLSPLLSVRAAAAAVAAVLSIGGMATAAYTRALPTPVQRVMHEIFGAPPPGGTRPGTPTAPATSATSATSATHPTPTGQLTTHPTPHGSGKPTGHPTPQGNPTAHPTPHGSGKPTGHPTPQGNPTPHGSGKPTSHP